ncbi:hypothetical protein Tco_0250091, partial [Tanacetum coccineum]
MSYQLLVCMSPETYSCLLRLKSSDEDDTVRMQPGSSETHIFLPDSLGDNLILEVHDSKGTHFGRVLVQVATISDDPVKYSKIVNSVILTTVSCISAICA